MLSLCLVDLTICAHRFLNSTGDLIEHTDTQLNKATLPQISKDVTQVALSVAAIQDDVDQIKPQVNGVLTQTTTTLKQTADTEASLSDNITKTRTQVDRLVIVAGGVATNIEKATRGMDKEENAQVQYLADLSKSMVKAINGLDKLIGDPLLQETIKNTADATSNLAKVTNNAAKLSDAYYKKLTAPVSFLKSAAGAVANFAARVLGAAI